jgi:hypothetical protein
MGTMFEAPEELREICIDVKGGAPIDYVDVVKNNRIVNHTHRSTKAGKVYPPESGIVRTKLVLEVGWGTKGEEHNWDATFGIDAGRIIAVEPQFRGDDVVSPHSAGYEEAESIYTFSSWGQEDDKTVVFQTKTQGNPTTSTPAMQRILLDVEAPVTARAYARFAASGEFPGKRDSHSILELMQGSCAGYVGGLLSPAYRFRRAPLPEEYEWKTEFLDHMEVTAPGRTPGFGGRDCYYVRVRQTNGQWAWSSPIWIPRE